MWEMVSSQLLQANEDEGTRLNSSNEEGVSFCGLSCPNYDFRFKLQLHFVKITIAAAWQINMNVADSTWVKHKAMQLHGISFQTEFLI